MENLRKQYNLPIVSATSGNTGYCIPVTPKARRMFLSRMNKQIESMTLAMRKCNKSTAAIYMEGVRKVADQLALEMED